MDIMDTNVVGDSMDVNGMDETETIETIDLNDVHMWVHNKKLNW